MSNFHWGSNWRDVYQGSNGAEVGGSQHQWSMLGNVTAVVPACVGKCTVLPGMYLCCLPPSQEGECNLQLFGIIRYLVWISWVCSVSLKTPLPKQLKMKDKYLNPLLQKCILRQEQRFNGRTCYVVTLTLMQRVVNVQLPCYSWGKLSVPGDVQQYTRYEWIAHTLCSWYGTSGYWYFSELPERFNISLRISFQSPTIHNLELLRKKTNSPLCDPCRAHTDHHED